MLSDETANLFTFPYGAEATAVKLLNTIHPALTGWVTTF